MRVFICSTCYDLVDLRAELEIIFREAGAEVLLSESMSSEFQVLQDRNSIETCLANVRSCDEFVIILSNRYGPSLANSGYEDISATHLEYREAVKHKKKIRMFVRDRLEADYALWKCNAKDLKLELTWCKEQKDRKIFTILEEHRKLAKESTNNNWIWIYRDSVEVKKHLAREFREAFARAAVSKLAVSGRIPFIEVLGLVKQFDGQYLHFELYIRNLADNVAVTPLLKFTETANEYNCESLAGRQSITKQLKWARSPGTQIKLDTLLTYSILEGHKFVDEGILLIDYGAHGMGDYKVSYYMKNRRYVGVETNMVLT